MRRGRRVTDNKLRLLTGMVARFHLKSRTQTLRSVFTARSIEPNGVQTKFPPQRREPTRRAAPMNKAKGAALMQGTCRQQSRGQSISGKPASHTSCTAAARRSDGWIISGFVPGQNKGGRICGAGCLRRKCKILPSVQVRVCGRATRNIYIFCLHPKKKKKKSSLYNILGESYINSDKMSKFSHALGGW